MILLSRCFTCFGKTKLIKKIRGFLLTGPIFCCLKGNKNISRSQPLVNRQSHGNIKLPAAVLLSANTYMRMVRYFRLAGVQCLSKTQYYAFQKKNLAAVVNEEYDKKKNALLDLLSVRDYCAMVDVTVLVIVPNI